MHLAAMYNHYACIDALLKHQSEAMDMRNDLGMTPLQVLIKYKETCCKIEDIKEINYSH